MRQKPRAFTKCSRLLYSVSENEFLTPPRKPEMDDPGNITPYSVAKNQRTRT